MKSIFVALIIFSLLTACGGGEAGLDLGLGVDLGGAGNNSGKAPESAPPLSPDETLLVIGIGLALLAGIVLAGRPRR